MHFSYLSLISSVFLFKDIFNLLSYKANVYFKSAISVTASSAAADGVGALKSATKSAIVKSVSCPTAEIIGRYES